MKDTTRYVPAGAFLVLTSPPVGDLTRLASLGFRLVRTRAHASALPVGHSMYADTLLFLPPGWTCHASELDPGGPIEVSDLRGRFRGQYLPEVLRFTLVRRYRPDQDGFIVNPSDPLFRRAIVRDMAHVPPGSLDGGPVVWSSPEEVVAGQDDTLAEYCDRLAARARQWLDATYPDWHDPVAYWETP